MKTAFFLSLILIAFGGQAQYQLYKETDSLQFYTKWSHVKWYSKKSGDVLLVKVVNKSLNTVEFSVGVEFFTSMKLAEESQVFQYCVESGKTLQPRVHGLVFQPASGSKGNYDSIELKDPDISKKGNSACPKKD